MKETDIVERIKNFHDCNMIATAISPWHANGIDASIMQLQNKGIAVKGIIFIGSHPTTGSCLTEDFFLCKGKDVQIIETCFETKTWLKKFISNIISGILIGGQCFKRNTKPFYILCPSYPDFNWIRLIRKIDKAYTVVFITIDEGCGAYTLSKIDTWVLMHLNRKLIGWKKWLNKVKLTLLALLRFYPKRFLTNLLILSESYINNNLLLNEGGSFSKNQNITPYYVQVFQQESKKISKKSIESLQKCILINTQCLEEDLLIKKGQDIAIYQRLFEVLDRFPNTKVIKPHPRELCTSKYSCFNCYINENKQYSQELLLSPLDPKPVCIIGILSSTLITSKVLYDIPTISLARMFLEFDITDDFKRTIEIFIQTFQNIIFFPNDENELKNQLEKYLSEER